MGLDMYLEKRRKFDADKERSEVAYWRKANQIHNWFVNNIQGGIDNCTYYEVTKEQLEDLLSVCKRVLDNCKLVDGKVANGYSYTNDENGNPIKKFNYEEGKVINNAELATELLPTQGGFFFGSTDYDYWYLEDIKDTISQITRILEETDWENEIIEYYAWW